MSRRALVQLSTVTALLLLVAGVFGQVRHHEFVDFDDFRYVRDNPRLDLGLTWEGVRTDFNEPYEAYWIPLTWVSLRVDHALYGRWAGGYLLTNVAIHAASVVVLFLGLLRMCRREQGAFACSAFVAAVFAIHPLHVESVAWVTERKDVLSGFFFVLAIAIHGGHRAGEGAGGRHREAGVALCMALGALAKPMIVTLPFVLLLLDYWPLRRLEGEERRGLDPRRVRAALLEKVPLFALSAVASLIVIGTQRDMGGMQFAGLISLPLRLANALDSYAIYLAKAVWPSGLAAIYPHPLEMPPLWRPAACLGLLAGSTAMLVRFRTHAPALLVGWLWFLGTLVPVIGLVGVGMQARADRWMYIPLIGLSIMAAFGTRDLVRRSEAGQRVALLAAAASIALYAAAAHAQVAVWRDTFTLFEHAIAVTEGNWYAHHRLGVNHRWAGRYPEAEHHFLEALRHLPSHAYMQGELADVLAAQGHEAEAQALYENVLRTGWTDPEADAKLGLVLARIGRLEVAVDLLERAVVRAPDDPQLLAELAIAHARLGHRSEAIASARRGVAAARALGWPAMADQIERELAEHGIRPD